MDGDLGLFEYFSKKASKITDQIYQGNYESAKDLQNLKDEGITHILTAGRLEAKFPNDFIYKKFEVDDIYSENLIKHFEEAYVFIDECISTGGKILIHCSAGVSRSSAFTLSYLIKKHSLSYDEAYNILKKGRSIAFPNAGFQMQLCDWYDLEVRKKKFRLNEKELS